MKIVCAWCGKNMGEKDSGGVEGVTHSVCEECLIRLKEQASNETSAKGEPDDSKSK